MIPEYPLKGWRSMYFLTPFFVRIYICLTEEYIEKKRYPTPLSRCILSKKCERYFQVLHRQRRHDRSGRDVRSAIRERRHAFGHKGYRMPTEVSYRSSRGRVEAEDQGKTRVKNGWECFMVSSFPHPDDDIVCSVRTAM